MDGLRRDDPAANDRLDLDRIREALGPQDPGGDTAGEERALPELPRSSPTDPVLGAFPDTGAPAPVMEE
ncbi:MAG: hypothetical protein FJ098_04765, partial [Deltaproteobacteria bacterium]|nr:hypothetical protein [Deltaproteobacteria bacterium]